MIKSVLKAIDILSLFSASEPRLTLAEISNRLGLHKSTAHHLLASLLSRGFVEKVDGDRYALGTAIIALTQGVRVNAELRDRAAPLLRELADSCRESVYLAVLDYDHALYVYAIESPRRLLARTAVGDRVLLHCTGVGKAILANLPPSRVEEIVTQVGLPPSTEVTITDAAMLHEELKQTRERGYAMDRQEHERSTYCVSAPIFDASGHAVAACSISGTDPEILGTRLDELAQRVRYVAQEASRRMGFIPLTQAMVVAPRSTTGADWGTNSMPHNPKLE